ncbi:hypothetical protein [Clostridium beijerinckii]|uniref:hypothetical protein n=1 Tax=Clostridium beijerinckii TaxID=1520 RepID=UPI00098C6CF1|nr:hypothetical protein [Clostridium beijerinckii]NRU38910.1 hypothetical protein [Clostridium beijerinckii]NSA97811.1 hypothetical protein [Clostridium beijerinckii]OOM68653.1 hypothetical protein CLOBI_02080 [Clostridium beijerinckii]OOM72638.1 hypothetical protein CLBEIC_06470 [Clostridium beijerinckii]CUU48443.1 conserved protein of unknown function [Clostridium beijerinckii]
MKFFNKLFGNKQDLQCQNESGIDSARLHRDDIVTNEKKEEVKYNKLNNILKEYIKWSKEPCIEDEALDILKIFGNDEFQALYVYVKENSNNDNVLHTLKVLGMSLNEMDISKACATAHYCGMLIEHSNILDISDNLVDLFEKVVNLSIECLNRFENIENADWAELLKTYTDEVKAYHSAEILTIAVMAVITRSPESRYYLRKKKLYEKLELLKPYIKSMVYVPIVHDACYDFKVLVLNPNTKKGFWMKVFDVHNCFYLMTLLEIELYKKGWLTDYEIKDYIFSQEIYDTAIGAYYPKKSYDIVGHASYQNYEAINDKENNSAIRHMIFGEMPPEYIPKYKGFPVIIMKEDPLKGRRSWDSYFIFKCHQALSPRIEILESLTEPEVEEWLS